MENRVSPSTDTVRTAIFSDGKTPLQTGSALLLLGRPPLLLIQATPSLPPFPPCAAVLFECSSKMRWIRHANALACLLGCVVAISLHSASTEQIIMDNCCSCHLPLGLNFEVRNCRPFLSSYAKVDVSAFHIRRSDGRGQSGGRALSLRDE